MENKIKTFIFDCFGVIYDPVLNGWYKEYRLKYGLIDPNLSNVFRDFDLGNLSEDDIVDYFSKYEGVTSTKKEIRDQIDNFTKLDLKLIKVIKKLKNKGFKVVLLSNANNAFFERKIYPTFPEFKSIFNEIIISSDIKMVKPDKEIFLYTMKKCDSKPEESLFIDDSQTNVDVAIGVGMNGFLYTDADSFINYVEKMGIDLEN